MRILVTGGAGYVGSACLRRMIGEGVEAIAYDDLSKGHRGAVAADHLVVGDIADVEKLERTLREFRAEAVMHFAAATEVGGSITDPDQHYDLNVGGTLRLLRAMRGADVRRLLFSSTCATYGDTPSCPIDESAPQNPCSPYARTKLSVEWMIRDCAAAYGFGFTLLRYFNAVGASADGHHGEDHRPETHLIPLTLQVPLGRRRKLFVFGTDYPTPDGTCLRDYVHVDDLADAHLRAIRATTPDTAEVFNIGTGTGNSVFEVLRACERVTGKQIPHEIVDRRPGDGA
jgi:UDP-glucose 4-epimerase